MTALWIGAADARYTCDSVARRGDLDPDGFAFTNKFEEPTGVNAAGDVTFIARAGNLQQALYRYPNGGPNSVIARVADPAPGGSAFTRFGASCFGTPSMNTAGNVAFVARLAIPGQGVFVDVGGTLEKLSVQHRQDGNGDVITRLFLRQSTAKHGLFRYDATPEAAVVKTDAPSAPPFGPFSKYRAISDASAAGTGTTIAFRAKMKDTINPGSKTGVLRCVP